jgi:hypothetical protein
MGLYCTNCKKGVPEGLSQCMECKAGYVHQLACLFCRRSVPRGVAMCGCSGLPVLPSPPPLDISQRQEIPETRISKVTPRSDLARMGSQMVGFAAPRSAPPIFQGLPSHVTALTVPEEYEAQRLTQFQGRNEHTQGLARSMRNLATEIQEEIEMRTGPPG